MALVAIVGRPNVGKSTLFNRLTKTRKAIVSEEAGTTRDRQYGKCEWCGSEFSVVDTGGWVVNSDDIFEEEIRKQMMIATEEADLVLFLVDIVNGLTDLDEGRTSPLSLSPTRLIISTSISMLPNSINSVLATHSVQVQPQVAAPATCLTLSWKNSKARKKQNKKRVSPVSLS